MSEDTIKRETIAVRRELTDGEIAEHKHAAAATYEEEEKAKARLRSLKEFAAPRALAAFNPNAPRADGEPATFEEARALNDALEREKKIRSSKVARAKAMRRHHIDAAANGYVYDVHDCRVELDASGSQVRYVSEVTEEVVLTRVATDEERQMSFPDAAPTSTGGAPAVVQ